MDEAANLNLVMTEIKDFRRELNGRVGRVETRQDILERTLREKDAAEALRTARLEAVEKTTKEIEDIAAFTRTVAKIAKWVTAICGAVASVGGVVAVFQGWLL